MKITLLLVLMAAACNSSSPPAASPAPVNSITQHTSPKMDIQVLVTLDGSRPMAEVVRDLENAGLVVERRLQPADIVTGHVPPDAMAALGHVKGVTAVERDFPVEIAPPGKPQ
jgi:hypothetical protein